MGLMGARDVTSNVQHVRVERQVGDDGDAVSVLVDFHLRLPLASGRARALPFAPIASIFL
jgi:hypothetical protein